MAHNDIVITGISAISAAGVGIDPLLDTLRSGESRLQPIPEEITGESGHYWGKADSFRAADFMSPLKARKFDRCSLLAVVATGMALKSAALAAGEFDPARVGIVLGCGFGGIAYADEFLRGYFSAGIEGLVPMLFPNIVPNAPASNASIEHKLKGPNTTTIQRFCSAESALLLATRFLEDDRADVIITGGVDEVYPGLVRGFQSIGQLRSYGSGFSEGAGLIVLERGAHARARKAPILAALGGIRTVGRLSAAQPEAGLDRLLSSPSPGTGSAGACPLACDASLVALSGTASLDNRILERLPATPRLDTGRMLGRSLAMGGLSLVSLVLSLQPGAVGLQVAASPEGPYYAVEVHGGDPVQP